MPLPLRRRRRRLHRHHVPCRTKSSEKTNCEKNGAETRARGVADALAQSRLREAPAHAQTQGGEFKEE